ncbi:MAG TPA: hypothetical protein PLB10_03520 [Thiolinea sp.]|nr:hypothetical protein [Thiolinea sp.]
MKRWLVLAGLAGLLSGWVLLQYGSTDMGFAFLSLSALPGCW